MGAFLLIKKDRKTAAKQAEQDCGDSLAVFEKKGLTLNKKIDTADFTLHVFYKLKRREENIVLFDDNQFIAAVGTCIYKRKIGAEALKQLYNDFSQDNKFLSGICGHYCVIIHKAGKLYVFNDFPGLYHTFCDQEKTVISSSFLAVMKALKRRTVSTQAVYEYLTRGAFYGDETLFNEIELIDSRKVWQVFPSVSAADKDIDTAGAPCEFSLQPMLDKFTGILTDYFNMLKDNFGDDICSAFTGGFDSRQLFAVMRRVGIKPSLYVYGRSDGFEVKVVKEMEKKEGLKIGHIDKDKYTFRKEDYAKILERNYYLYDGYASYGVFDNGADWDARLKRAEKGRLHLNGGGGDEFFRNYWKLGERSFRVKDFITSFYDYSTPSIFTDCYDRKAYCAVMKEKLVKIAGYKEESLTRRQLYMANPYFELKYWQGHNNLLNNQLTYALTPYCEMPVILATFDIPVKYRNLGRFNAALIKHLDPAIAGYTSRYGFNFAEPKIKFSMKLPYYALIQAPIWMRPVFKKSHISRDKANLPFYLKPDYLSEIFPKGLKELNMTRFAHVDKIYDTDYLSRALTLELLMTDRF